LLAGPVILIATALSLIFTVGLGDSNDRDGLSAYAVFNRGFERLLGEVDAEALMAQHVGGALLGGGGGGMPPRNDDNNERDRGVARRRRPNRAIQNNNDKDNDNAGDNDNAAANDNNTNNNNRARKSGKKARRRDLQQRREVQNQREAAAAMGMQMGNEAMEEQVAMQRLIEEQVAAENQDDE
jgi:hypothetical protein